ncbi:hypothetical protein ABBQ32_001978 [Trebouxia sp. C0010 RCD-2024]
MANKVGVGHQFSGVRLQFGRPARAVGQAYSLRQGRPVCDADYAPGRTRYENTGQLQLLRKSYQYGTPTNSPTLGSSRSNQTSTKEIDVQELTQQLKIPLYKQLIGNTAMVDLSSLSANPQVKILGKCEFANPSGSIKDRIADHILTTAEQEGKLKPGGTVVAATSGNTGASVAMIAAMKGYHYIVITNEKTSKEKCDAMRSYGGEVIVAPSGVAADHPDHYQNLAVTLCKQHADYFDVDQYDNPNNPEAYYRSLGPEVWMQTKSRVTHFVAGGSTGGTISGTGRFLKDMNPNIMVMLPDPVGSVFWDYWANRIAQKELKPKSYQCEGVGKDSIPGAIDFDVVDDMMQVTDKQSFTMCRRLAQKEGMLVGGSAGLNLHAAVEISKTAKPGSVIVAILADNGVKYLTKIYNNDWIKAKNFDEASADPQAHLVDGPLKTARSAGSNFYSEDAGNGAPKRPAAAPEARKAIANEWITPDFAGMGI